MAALTAMSLCVGYIVAAAGPWLLGAVHDAAGGWTLALIVFAGICLLELAPGLPASRARTIEEGTPMKTQVGIVGAGPAGLVLARLLELRGISSVVLEARSRDYVEQRVRAGVLEQRSVDCLGEAGVADRLHEEGMVHHGIELRFGGQGHRIDFTQLTNGKSITVYGQQEVVKDLIAARLASELPLLFEVSDVAVDVDRPAVSFTHEGSAVELECDVIAGCDGFHGVCRDAIADRLTVFERVYPFAWLGILARSKPSSEELIYANHEPRLRAALDALAVGHPLLPAGLAGGGHRRVARRADLGGAQRALRARLRLLAQRGRDLREGRHADALVRRRADAARQALPRRRRGAHRAADRREGDEPGDRRRRDPRRGARVVLRVRRRERAAVLLRATACAASGGSSTSPTS